MRASWMLVVLGFSTAAVSGCGPTKRDIQLERAAKANWTRSLLFAGGEDTTALGAWRNLCRACAPDPACSAEEQKIRTDPRHAGPALEQSLCEAQQYEAYRSKPSFLR
jgi:hypothetical protein